jgi:hypothetical protein
MTICFLVIIDRRSHEKTFLSANERLPTSILYAPLRGARHIAPVSILVTSYGILKLSGHLMPTWSVVLGPTLPGFVSYNISAIISGAPITAALPLLALPILLYHIPLLLASGW